METGEERSQLNSVGRVTCSYIIVQPNDLGGSILSSKCLLNIDMNSEDGFLGYIFCFVETFLEEYY